VITLLTVAPTIIPGGPLTKPPTFTITVFRFLSFRFGYTSFDPYEFSDLGTDILDDERQDGVETMVPSSTMDEDAE
jgi:hypothetical protein